MRLRDWILGGICAASAVTLTLSYLEYNFYWNAVRYRIAELKQQNDLLESRVLALDSIVLNTEGNWHNRCSYDLSFTRKEINLSLTKQLEFERSWTDTLWQKILCLNSYDGLYVDHFVFCQDKLSKDLLFGVFDRLDVPASYYVLKLNSDEIVTKSLSQYQYTVSNKDTLDINVLKIRYNWHSNRIDTLKVTRQLCL